MAWPVAWALTAAVCFAAASVLLKRGFQYAHPHAGAVISVTFTAGVIWLVALITARLPLLLSWHIVPFLLAGLIAPGLARLVYYQGMDRIGVARATSLVSAQPLFAIALAIAFLGERPTARLVLGALTVVAGGALLSARARAEQAWRRRDLVWPLLGAAGFACRDVVSRYGFRDFADPMAAAAAATLSSVLVMWTFAGVRGGNVMRPGRTALAWLGLAGLCEGGAYLTMWRALAIGDVSIVSPLVSTQPLFAILLATVFLRDLERVTWRIVLASALIVTGIALVVRYR